MHPIEFITELCGIAKVLGPDEAPTPAQWKRIHEMLAETMGPLAARKLIQLGEEAERQKEGSVKLWYVPRTPHQQGVLPFGGGSYSRLYVESTATSAGTGKVTEIV